MATPVTGGNGFIGSYVIKALQERGEEVACFDIVEPPSKILNLFDLGKMKFIRGDVQNAVDLFRIIKEKEIDQNHSHRCFVNFDRTKNPLLAFEVNTGGTLNILEAARFIKIKRIVFCCSVTTNGAISQQNQSEGYSRNRNCRTTFRSIPLSSAGFSGALAN